MSSTVQSQQTQITHRTNQRSTQERASSAKRVKTNKRVTSEEANGGTLAIGVKHTRIWHKVIWKKRQQQQPFSDAKHSYN